MSGCTKGVQERFRRDVPQAVYTNCYAHRLHLVLVNCVKNIRSISEFFVTIQSLYNSFSSSVVHQKFQKEQNTESPHVEVKRLSDTRWACQHSADRASGARSLAALLDHQFVTNLVFMEWLLRVTKTLSDQLQSADLQLYIWFNLARKKFSLKPDMYIKFYLAI